MGVAPSQTIEQARFVIAAIEGFCAHPEAEKPNPARMSALRAYVRAVLAGLEFVVEGSRANFFAVSVDQLTTIDSLRERADELIDTLGWGAEAHAELTELMREEACG